MDMLTTWIGVQHIWRQTDARQVAPIIVDYGVDLLGGTVVLQMAFKMQSFIEPQEIPMPPMGSVHGCVWPMDGYIPRGLVKDFT